MMRISIPTTARRLDNGENAPLVAIKLRVLALRRSKKFPQEALKPNSYPGHRGGTWEGRYVLEVRHVITYFFTEKIRATHK
jgi:hypothetical protein